MQTFQPAEVLLIKNTVPLFQEKYGKRFHLYGLDAWIFDQRYAEENLIRHFGTHSLKGFGVDDMKEGIVAAGAILHYLNDTVHSMLTISLPSIGSIRKNICGWINSRYATLNWFSRLFPMGPRCSSLWIRRVRRWGPGSSDAGSSCLW